MHYIQYNIQYNIPKYSLLNLIFKGMEEEIFYFSLSQPHTNPSNLDIFYFQHI